MRIGNPPKQHQQHEAALTWLVTKLVVTLVYKIMMVLSRVLTNKTSSLWLAILTTNTVTTMIGPTQGDTKRLTAQLLHGTHRNPYDILTQFTSQVNNENVLTKLPAKITRLLSESTTTQWAQM